MGEQLVEVLDDVWQATLETSSAQIGSGALPDKTIDSWSLTLRHADKSADAIAELLRNLPVPVIGRISEDRVWLDLRGADPLDELAGNLRQLQP